MTFRLASRTNVPPKNIDEQAIPRSLEHIIKLKEAAKTSDILKRKRNKKKNALICVGLQHSNSHPKARPEKIVPLLRQKPGESGQQFWHRVSKDTHAFLKETAFERKYGVQVERDPETGLIQGLTKRKVEKDDIGRLRAKHNNTGKKKTTTQRATSLTKSEKRKLKLYLKEEEKLKEADEFERLQDKVAFGEVVHEPPKLNINKKTVDAKKKPKNLLLNLLLEADPKVNPTSNIVDRSGKRKNLPAAERRRLEKEQSDIIAIYRRLKSQRSADKSC